MFHESNYIVCHPTAGGNFLLQIRQEFYDKYSGNTRTKAEWELLARGHNAEFNKDGVPWKVNRRSAPTTVEEACRGAQEVELEAQPPAKRQELLDAGAHTVSSADGKFEFLIHDGGKKLYAWAIQDALISREKPMFLLRGNFKWGATATHTMSLVTNPWVKSNLESNSVVLANFIHPVAPGVQEFSQGPRPLGALLAALELAGHVRISMHKHTYCRDVDSPHGYKVSATEDLCLIPKASQEGTPCLLQMSTWLDVNAVKGCSALEILHMVTYDKELNKIVPDVPGVFPKTPIRVRAATLYALY